MSLQARLLLLCIVCLPDAACVPTDQRPPPGRLTLAVGPAAADFDTTDGWRVHIDKWLVSIGRTDLFGDDCALYNDIFYVRVLDLLAPAPQKISTVHALGRCNVVFAMLAPGGDTVQGAGVAAEDFLSMQGGAAGPAGTALWIRGTATRAERVLAFEWRTDEQWLWECGETHWDGGMPIPIAGGVDLTATVQARPDALFDAGLTGSVAGSAFDPIAGADSDADGVVTQEELMQVPPTAGKPTFIRDAWEQLQFYGVSKAFAGIALSTGDRPTCTGSFGSIQHKGLPGM